MKIYSLLKSLLILTHYHLQNRSKKTKANLDSFLIRTNRRMNITIKITEDIKMRPGMKILIKIQMPHMNILQPNTMITMDMTQIPRSKQFLAN